MDDIWDYEDQVDFSAADAEQVGIIAKKNFGKTFGSETLRVMRVIRLLRLIRISRLWKQANMLMNRSMNRIKQEEQAVGQKIQQQRTINLLKKQKELASNLADN